MDGPGLRFGDLNFILKVTMPHVKNALEAA